MEVLGQGLFPKRRAPATTFTAVKQKRNIHCTTYMRKEVRKPCRGSERTCPVMTVRPLAARFLTARSMRKSTTSGLGKKFVTAVFQFPGTTVGVQQTMTSLIPTTGATRAAHICHSHRGHVPTRLETPETLLAGYLRWPLIHG